MSKDIRLFDGSITASITLAFSNFSKVHPSQMKKTSGVKEESKRTFVTPQKITKPDKTISLGAYQAHIHSVRSSGINISDDMNGNGEIRNRDGEEEKVNLDALFVNEDGGPGTGNVVTSSMSQSVQEGTRTIFSPKQETARNIKSTEQEVYNAGCQKAGCTIAEKCTQSIPSPLVGPSPPQATGPSTEVIQGKTSTPSRRVIFPTLHDAPKNKKDGLFYYSHSNITSPCPFQIENPLAPLFPPRSSTEETASSLTSGSDRADSRVKMDMSALYIPPFHHNERTRESQCWNKSSSNIRAITHAQPPSPTSIINKTQKHTHSPKSPCPGPSILKSSHLKPTMKQHYTGLPMLGKVPSKLRLSFKDLHLFQLRTQSQEGGEGDSSSNVNNEAEDCNSSLLDVTNHKLNLQINDVNLSKLDGDVQSAPSQKATADRKRVSFCKCLLSSSLKKCLSDTCLDQRILVDVDEFVGRSKVSKSSTTTKGNGYANGSQSDSCCSRRTSVKAHLQTNMTRHFSHEEMGQKRIRFDPRIWVHEFPQEPKNYGAWYTAIDMDRFKHEVLHRIRRYERRKESQSASQRKKRAVHQMDILSSGTGRIISLGQTTRRKRRSVRALYTNPALTAEAESSEDEGNEDNEAVLGTDQMASRRHQQLDELVRSEIRRVLLVEPHDIFTRLLTKSIRAMLPNAQIICVRTGEEALECIARAKQTSQRKGESYEFDLVIAEERLHTNDQRHDGDRSLNVEKSIALTGSAFLRILKDRESLPQISSQNLNSSFLHRVPLLIGMSAYSEQDGDKLRKSGSDFVWSKPPPNMDTIMKASLLRTLMRKRNKGDP